MLSALSNFSPTTTTAVVKAPRLYLFNRETNTQVQEDFPDMVDFKAVLLSRPHGSTPTQLVPTSIGRSLGSWLRSFHTWSSAPTQASLRVEIGKNGPMRALKYRGPTEGLSRYLGSFPGFWKATRRRWKLSRTWRRASLRDHRRMEMKTGAPYTGISGQESKSFS
jgi:hypothetical protein